MKEFDLENHKMKSGFKIPENYFESFESKMMEKVTTEKEPKVVSLFNKQIWISAVAAVFVALLAIPFYFNSVNNTTVETTTLENYLTNELNTYEIVDNLTTEDILSLENEVTFNDDAVENYLLEQNLDYYLNE